MRRAVWLLAVGGIAAGCGPTVTFPGTGEGGATSAGTTTGPSSGQGGTTTSGETTSGETTSNVTGSSGVGGSTSVTSTSGSGVTVTGTSVASSVASTGSGPTTTSGVGGGMPGCKTCSEAIQGAPGQFCMGSQPLFDALIQCACNVNCPMDCYNACNGNPGDQGCDLCIYTYCYNELSACQADM